MSTLANPEMVLIPSGEFLMGSKEDEEGRLPSEGPQHKVSIQSFYMGKYAVTFDEYDYFCEVAERMKPPDDGWYRGRYPVINIYWLDAIRYVEWLSSKTGRCYRLPTEAEWEYAARAGTTTAFWWGDDIDTSRANYNGESTYWNENTGEYEKLTVPVDSFHPNPFGLYQVHGNVLEWVQDNWHKNYEGAPVDGSAWVEGNNQKNSHVLRGGSWSDDPRWVRSATRYNGCIYDWNTSQWGFRLAMTLPD